MPFRADEATTTGYETARSYLVARQIDAAEKGRSQRAFDEIVEKYGPVVEAYPSWHPLVWANDDPRRAISTPSRECGYQGLDHTVYFAYGFVTCPYGDGQQVIDSVEQLQFREQFQFHPLAKVTAERVDAQLYNPQATPILVACEWDQPLPLDRMIPKSRAIPLLLEKELPCWRAAQLAETWETMRPYFLGRPHGSRSSLFVTQETGQTIKRIWNALIHTGMFGPIKV